MTPKPIEPMPLDEVRERFRYTATSQVSTWEPADVARMRVTFEALVAVYEEARNVATLPRNEWPTLSKLVDAVVATKPKPRDATPLEARIQKITDAVRAAHDPTPLEALIQELTDVGIEFDAGRLNTDRDYFEAKQRAVVWVRCLVTDEIPHAGVVGGRYARRCTLRAAHDGPCVFGEP